MRELVGGMCSDWAVSIRMACGALRFDRSSFHYKFRRADQALVEKRIREICETRVRYGYRRVHMPLRREGWEINMKRTSRIYSEFGLQLRNKLPKRRHSPMGYLSSVQYEVHNARQSVKIAA